MKTNIIGSSTHSTGDIKLAAALMAVGVPLDPKDPARVIHQEGKPSYASFRLMHISADGKDSTQVLMKFWSDPSKAPPTHPFTDLMQFLKAAPAGITKSADWLTHANDWLARLRQRPPDSPRRVEDIGAFVARHNDLAGYVFAFVANRETCFEEYTKALERPDYLLTKGKAITKINHHTPARIADELLARLDG